MSIFGILISDQLKRYHNPEFSRSSFADPIGSDDNKEFGLIQSIWDFHAKDTASLLILM